MKKYGGFLGLLTFLLLSTTIAGENITTEFCLEGEFDLGLRLQGYENKPGEFYPMRWCVIYESKGERVQFSSNGHINADATDNFTLRYLADNTLQIMSPDNQPVVAFVGAVIDHEAKAQRRIDPHFLLEELEAHPEFIVSIAKSKLLLRYPGAGYPVTVVTHENRVVKVITKADFPIRGTAKVSWHWDWSESSTEPQLSLNIEGKRLFKAASSRRQLSTPEVKQFWASSEAPEVRQIPGKVWPSRVNMTIETISPGVFMVNGVRTGFHHLVVKTKRGLVVVDAPAGWIEIQQIPPADLVPGLGVSGLSEQFVDFLHRQFPETPVSAVLLTHIHDDHAGGARAFAAAGAEVYAPAGDVAWLNQKLNQESMPKDRMTYAGTVSVKPLSDNQAFGEDQQQLQIKTLPGNPHVKHAVAVWLPHNKLLYVSDIKVPHSAEAISDATQKARYCWFANWAESQLPQNYEVLDVHSHHRIKSEVIQGFSGINHCQE